MHPSCAGGRITGHRLTLASGPALCSGGGHWNKTSLTVRDTAHRTLGISQNVSYNKVKIVRFKEYR